MRVLPATILATTGLFAVGCQRPAAPVPTTPVTVVVDDYATQPVATLRLAVDDAGGSLVRVVDDDGSGEFSADVPEGGSVTLIIGRTGGWDLREWVAPPVPTIHASILETTIPATWPVSAADATTWSVDASGVPASAASVALATRCGSGWTATELGTTAIPTSDLRCASESPASMVGIALDAKNHLVGWGEATGLTASPGNTVPVSISLSGAVRQTTETTPVGIGCYGITSVLTPDGIEVGLQSTNAIGTFHLGAASGIAGTSALLMTCRAAPPVENVMHVESLSPIPDTHTFDPASFPALGPVQGARHGRGAKITWGLDAPFGTYGYARVDWMDASASTSASGSAFLEAWLPGDALALIVPELPSGIPRPTGLDNLASGHVDLMLVDNPSIPYATAVSTFWGTVPREGTWRMIEASAP